MDYSLINQYINAEYAQAGLLFLVGSTFCYFLSDYFLRAVSKENANIDKCSIIAAVTLALLVWAMHQVGLQQQDVHSQGANYTFTVGSLIYLIVIFSMAIQVVARPGPVLYKWLLLGALIGVGIASSYFIQLAAYRQALSFGYELALILLTVGMAVVMMWAVVIINMRLLIRDGKVSVRGNIFAVMMFSLCVILVQHLGGYAFSIAPQSAEANNTLLSGAEVIAFYIPVVSLIVALILMPIVSRVKLQKNESLENVYPDVLMATGIMLALSLILFSQWYNNYVHEKEVSLLYLEQQIDRRISRAHLWLEELRNDSPTVEWDRDVVENLLLASKYAKASLSGEVVDGIFSYRAEDPNLVDVFQSIEADIAKWYKVIIRHKERESDWGNAFYIQLEDHVFSTLDNNLTLLGAITERTTKEEWDNASLVNKVTLLCLVMLLAAMFRIYHKNKARMIAMTASLQTAFKEIEVQKTALDEHSIVSVADRNGKITYSNKKFTEISQYEPEELMGKDHRVLNSGYHSREFFRDLWITINRGKIWRGRIRNRRKDGGYYWVDTTIVPFLDENDKPYQFVSIRNDITLVKEVEEKQRNLNQELERRVTQRTAELAETNRAIEADREALKLMVEGTSAATGKDFFNLLVRYLAAVLQVEYVVVAEQLYTMPLKSRTISVRANNSYVENFEYELEGTPCEEVIVNRSAIYARSIGDTFSHLALFEGVEIESYMGIPMSDSRGRILGHIAVFDSKEFNDKHRLKSIMRIFAARAASELERQHVEEQLKKARDRAVAASRSKSEFLANMSHELRTPMHAILSFATMGREDAVEGDREEIEHYFQRIHQSGERLMGLLNDLLDLSKLNAGKMTFEFASHDLYEHVKTVVNEYEAMFATKSLTPVIVEPEFDANAYFDKDRIAQVIRNLITNAIKFSREEKTITVNFLESQISLATGVTEAITIEVIDQGVGVPKEEHSTIFEQFQQSTRTNRQAGGTGLGLAICKEIVTAHAGEIRVLDNPKGGAVFRVTLPKRVPVH